MLAAQFKNAAASDLSYNGPIYDLYQVIDGFPRSGARKNKLFYWNQKTRALDRVRYSIVRGGVPISVDVLLGGWHTVQGEQVVSTMTRQENGVTVMTLTISAAAIVPKSGDDIFIRP